MLEFGCPSSFPMSGERMQPRAHTVTHTKDLLWLLTVSRCFRANSIGGVATMMMCRPLQPGDDVLANGAFDHQMLIGLGR